jgi:hypothetical protein
MGALVRSAEGDTSALSPPQDPVVEKTRSEGEQMAMKPMTIDILRVCANIAVRDWIDPLAESGNTYWDCTLVDLQGNHVGDGQACRYEDAMALAWICYWDPDALINGEAREIPYNVPPGWRFELSLHRRGIDEFGVL